MTPAGRSLSTQRIGSGTAQLSVTPVAAGLLLDLHYIQLCTQARDRSMVLVEPTRDGTQSCVYHIVVAFVGQSMTQVRRDLGAWYLQPTSQA